MTGCNYFNSKVCQSCDLLELPYQQQLERKHDALHAAFAAAGVTSKVLPPVGSDSALASRNKAKMAVGGSSQRPRLGFVSADYRIVDIPACPLHIAPIPEIIAAMQQVISDFDLRPYNISTRKGELKYVLVRASETTGQVSVRLVLRSRNLLEEAREALLDLQAQFPQVVVISANIQSVAQAIVEGPEEVIFSKQDFIVDTIAGKDFTFSPQSFSQVTTNVAAKLYTYVSEVVRDGQVSTLLDLYCGVGTFSIVCAAYVQKGMGVELSVQAIDNANRALSLNGISNMSFTAADVETMLSFYSAGADCIIVNPPRRGLSPKIIEDLQRIAPKLLIYSSCNPESLLRDLKPLQECFSIRSVQPFDMFPLTSHVETVVVLDRK